jgi:hypothetical protein
MGTRTWYSALSWARCIHSIPSHPISWHSILILSSHLGQGFSCQSLSFMISSQNSVCLYCIFSPMCVCARARARGGRHWLAQLASYDVCRLSTTVSRQLTPDITWQCKEHLQASSAELIHSEPLWLPEFFTPSLTNCTDATDHILAAAAQWETLTHTSIPACHAIYLHLQGLGCCFSCLFAARFPLGSLASPICWPQQGM